MATLDAQIQVTGSSLTDLDGLASLTSPVYAVLVQSNSVLSSVLGLAGIGTTSWTPAVVSTFTISGNAVLDDCHVTTDVVNVIEARNPGGAFGVAPVISNVPCGQQD